MFIMCLQYWIILFGDYVRLSSAAVCIAILQGIGFKVLSMGKCKCLRQPLHQAAAQHHIADGLRQCLGCLYKI